ncbi:hypothetical protein, partial [Aphanizomenon flos-aquae]|uniref:hypothetical protein n=1 Tax=Aphanizomenon flos-aquae TaxID=1176 RepID=UPI001A7E8E4E
LRIPGCRDSKNVVSEDLDWSVQLAISYKLSPFRAELLTMNLLKIGSKNNTLAKIRALIIFGKNGKSKHT